ncbi:MAG: glycosyltransferase [Oligoflexia bacterium]|nr:glycosyltransferase [Oligoflexia bacterium]
MHISIIIPTFNREKTIKRAINSVVAQTHSDWELIIIDDGSTDETKNIVDSFSDDRIQYFYIENSGVSKARNFGIAKTRSDWIALLDSDDEWLPKKLEEQIKEIEKNPESAIIHTEEIWIRNGKRVNQKKIHQKYGGYIFDKCIPLCVISPSSSLIKKDILYEVGNFDESFTVCEDYDLWLKICSLYSVSFIETPLINKYGGHEDQLSAKYRAMDLWRVKALDRILKIRALKESEKNLVIETILKKAQILRNGYLKHNNLEDLPFIEEILSRYS